MFRREKDTKQLFGFICVLATFLSVEIVYGLESNSLGLLSDAFNIAFHCLALTTSLVAMVLARKVRCLPDLVPKVCLCISVYRVNHLCLPL